MCDFQKAISRAFTPAGTGGLEAAQIQAADIAKKSAADALEEQQKARDQAAEIAASGAAGSDKARRAAEARMRKLLETQGFAGVAFGGAGAPAAPVAYRTATGA